MWFDGKSFNLYIFTWWRNLYSLWLKILFTERASKSINQLKHALGEKDLTMGESTASFAQLFPDAGYDASEDTAWQELQHSHAGLNFSISGFLFIQNDCVNDLSYHFLTVNQLKALLRQEEENESGTAPSRRRMSSSVSIILFVCSFKWTKLHACWQNLYLSNIYPVTHGESSRNLTKH